MRINQTITLHCCNDEDDSYQLEGIFNAKTGGLIKIRQYVGYSDQLDTSYIDKFLLCAADMDSRINISDVTHEDIIEKFELVKHKPKVKNGERTFFINDLDS